MEQELNRLDEIETDLQEIYQVALEARDAAQRVLNLTQSLSTKLTQMEIAIQQARLEELDK